MVWLVAGLLSAGAGAVFIFLGIWQFAFDSLRSVFSPSLWLWVGAHAAAALLSLVFFSLAAASRKAAGGRAVAGEGE